MVLKALFTWPHRSRVNGAVSSLLLGGASGSAGGGGAGYWTPLVLAHDVGFLTLGPKVGPLLCGEPNKLDPLPFSKTCIPSGQIFWNECEDHRLLEGYAPSRLRGGGVAPPPSPLPAPMFTVLQEINVFVKNYHVDLHAPLISVNILLGIWPISGWWTSPSLVDPFRLFPFDNSAKV